MVQYKFYIALMFIVILSGCTITQNTPFEQTEITQTQTINTTNLPSTSIPSILHQRIEDHFISSEEVSSILDWWILPGIDKSQILHKTYCGLDCFGTEWTGLFDKNGKRLVIVVIYHKNVDDANKYIEVFEDALSYGFLEVDPLNNVLADEVRNGVNIEFSYFYTIIREANITVDVSMELVSGITNDVERRGAIVVSELYARRQLDKLIEAGFFEK